MSACQIGHSFKLRVVTLIKIKVKKLRIWSTTSETVAIGCTAPNRSFQIGEGIGVIINFMLEKMIKKIHAFLTHNWLTMGRF